MKIDSSQTEDKIMKAAGSIAGEALEEAPKAAEISLIPKRNDQARRTDGVYVLEEILSMSEIEQLRKAGRSVRTVVTRSSGQQSQQTARVI